ncbi:MAG: hypothetical protein ACR2IF_11970 [Terriglobales bacterium]
MARSAFPERDPRFLDYPEPGSPYDLRDPDYGRVEVERGRSTVSEAAEKIGTIMGAAVDQVRRLPDRLEEMKHRFTVISGRAREDAKAKASDLTEEARLKAWEARTRAERLAHDYPVQVIAGAAAAGLVVGILLRLWRDHAD